MTITIYGWSTRILTSALQQELRTLVHRQQGQLRWDFESCRQWFERAHRLLQAIGQTPRSAMSDALRTALMAEMRRAAYEASILSRRILPGPSIVPPSSFDTARAATQQQIAASIVPTSFRDRLEAAMQQQIAPSSTMPTSSHDAIRKAQRPDCIGGI
jgi:hypothetical protein